MPAAAWVTIVHIPKTDRALWLSSQKSGSLAWRSFSSLFDLLTRPTSPGFSHSALSFLCSFGTGTPTSPCTRSHSVCLLSALTANIARPCRTAFSHDHLGGLNEARGCRLCRSSQTLTEASPQREMRTPARRRLSKIRLMWMHYHRSALRFSTSAISSSVQQATFLPRNIKVKPRRRCICLAARVGLWPRIWQTEIK